MAFTKKTVLLFSTCDGRDLRAAAGPALEKLLQKGVVFNHVATEGDLKTLAATGAKSGETLGDAATAQGLAVTDKLEGDFDLCVLDAGATPGDVEKAVAAALDCDERTPVIALAAPGLLVFHGPGFAKGKEVESAVCPCVTAPTLACAANLPLPAQCVAPVAYAAFKDINIKFQEIRKLHSTIANMEAAMERKSRQPWDKHDCA